MSGRSENQKDPKPAPNVERMARHRHARLQQQIAAADCAGALLFGSMNARYATDTRYAQITNMHSPQRAIFVPHAGKSVVFESPMYSFGEKPDFVGEYREPYIAAYFRAGDTYPHVTRDFAREVIDLVRSHGGGSKRIAVDQSEPEFIIHLHEAGLEIVNAEKLVERAGAVKSEDELRCISIAIAAAEEGLARIRENLEPGITEQALWGHLAFENARHGGEWFEYCILASGQRTNPWGQEHSDKVIRAGELVGVDTGMIGPYGYGADVSRTFHCGPVKPTDEQKRLYHTAMENLAFNLDLIRPGMTFREFSAMSWPVPDEFWACRYNAVAHGVGMGNEWPHIPFIADWPADERDGVFEENMVLAIESCIGREGGAECVKLEDMVVVRADHCEKLSNFPLEEALIG